MKRPRAPIACFRCHRKKVRCDGAHPFCTRCQSTGSTCSYPSSRRSRNTQPHHVDPYIDHLSQLEHQIRQIEVDMNEYRNMLLSSLINNSMDPTLGNTATTAAGAAAGATVAAPNGNNGQPHPQEDMLRSHLSKTEQEVQESRTILAQLRLRGEQRIARTKRNQTKEAKQQQQRQQQQQHRASSVSSNNDKKKSTTTVASSSSRTKIRKNESATIPTSSHEVIASSSSPVSYLDSSSATKPVNNKPGMKSYLPSSSSSSSNTLQHVPTHFLPINTSMDLYGQSSMPPALPSPSTSYQQLYHQQQQQQQQQHPHHPHHPHHQHTSSGGYPMPPPPPPQQQQQQQQSTDLYYMTMVGGDGTSAGPTTSNSSTTTAGDAYYDPLMDYPWTTPTDFAATTDLHVSGANNQDLKPVSTTVSIQTPTVTNSSMENEIKSEPDQHQESAHYSPSTVAAIEEVTRMAQQMNHPHQQ